MCLVPCEMQEYVQGLPVFRGIPLQVAFSKVDEDKTVCILDYDPPAGTASLPVLFGDGKDEITLVVPRAVWARHANIIEAAIAAVGPSAALKAIAGFPTEVAATPASRQTFVLKIMKRYPTPSSLVFLHEANGHTVVVLTNDKEPTATFADEIRCGISVLVVSSQVWMSCGDKIKTLRAAPAGDLYRCANDMFLHLKNCAHILLACGEPAVSMR